MKSMVWNFKQFYGNTALKEQNGDILEYQQLETVGEELAGQTGGRCLVFLMCSNSAGSVVGYTAFMQNGIVPVLLSAGMEEGLLNNLLEVYKPSFIWLPDSISERYPQFTCVYSAFSYKLLRTNYNINYPLYKNLGLLLTTSGSTGSIKFVRQTYENVRVNAEQIAEYLEINETERAITTLPMNYTYGCSIINSHLLKGAEILLTDQTVIQRDFWKFFNDGQATSFGGVPYTYEMLSKMHFANMELPSLRIMTQAGGKLSPELHRKFAEYAINSGKRFVVMYGACEATARMGYLPYNRSLEKCGSMGIAIPGGRFSLTGPDGNEITEPGITGELVYEGRNVTMGYAECGEDLIKGDERHGRLETGDMAKMDADGFYYITGRKKRFLKIFGNRVNLDEIDIMLKEKFGPTDCASVGTDDHMYVFVTEKDIVKDVRNYLTDKTKLNQNAFKVYYIENISKNASGKTLYKELHDITSKNN